MPANLCKLSPLSIPCRPDGSGTVRKIRSQAAGLSISIAAAAMHDLGMKGAELRVVGGKNIMDLSDSEIGQTMSVLEGYGMEVVSIATPLLKCSLPDAPEVDSRFSFRLGSINRILPAGSSIRLPGVLTIAGEKR